MKNRFAKTLLPAAGILILAASPCLSQGAPQGQTDSQAPRRRMHQIPLRYVKPSVMAWWLDPKNNARPVGATSEMRFREMPAGIDRIVAIDPQNALLVFGTDEGVRQLRNLVQFLDRPGDKIPLLLPANGQIIVGARLLTIETGTLSGIWAALATQTGRATPAAAFLKPEEEVQLGEQIGRREARFERTENLSVASGASRVLDFGPAASGRSNRSLFDGFQSAMPVIPPPETGDMRNFGAGQTGNLLPAPLGALSLRIAPTVQSDNAVSLALSELEQRDILGRAKSAHFEMRAGETLALALPASTPGTTAFLLFTARPSFQYAPLYRAPNWRELPGVGGLFSAPAAPEKAP